MAAVDPRLYEQAGSTFNIDPLLLRAVSGVESNEDTSAVGPPTRYGNARGNMQLIDQTAKRYNVADPHEPTQAVFGAAAYLSDLLDQNKGDVLAALQQYNGATGDTSRAYAKLVAARYVALQVEAKKKPNGASAPAAETKAAPPSDALSDVDKFLTSPTPTKPAAAAPSAPTATEPPTTDALSDVDRFLAPSSPPAASKATGATALPEEGPREWASDRMSARRPDDDSGMLAAPPVAQSAPAPAGPVAPGQSWWNTPVADLIKRMPDKPARPEPPSGPSFTAQQPPPAVTSAPPLDPNTPLVPQLRAMSVPQLLYLDSNPGQLSPTIIKQVLDEKLVQQPAPFTAPGQNPNPSPTAGRQPVPLPDVAANMLQPFGVPSAQTAAPPSPLAPAATPSAPPPPAATPAPVVAAAQPASTTTPAASDWIPPAVRNFGSGVVQGARDVGQTIAGWERQANEAVPALGAIDRFTGTDPGRAENLLAGQTKEFEKTQGDSTAASIGRIAGNVGLTTAMLPVGIAGRGAATVAEAVVPRAANLLRGVTEGAVAGGGTSALTSGPSGENPLAAAGEGALMGGALGGAMPLVRGGISALSGSSGRALRAIADRLGIELTTGQEVGGAVGRVEDASRILPFSGSAKAASKQNGQIAQVIAKEAGIPGPVQQLTTATLNTAEGRIGAAIDNAAGRIDVPGGGPAGNALLNKLGQIETNSAVSGTDAPQAKAAKKLIDRIITTMSNRGGSMPGADFQKFISNTEELQAAINTGGEVGKVATAIKNALLDAAEQSGSTGVKDLQTARYQWKVVQTVRDAIDKTATGSEDVSQAKLAQLIRREFNMKNTGPGNNMQDLARLIEGIKPLPSSGTAERLATYGALGLGGAGAGAWYYDPDQMEDLMLRYGPHAAALLSAGRLSRFGPSMGVQLPAGVAGLVNPLAPRVAGPLYRPPPSDNALAQP
jgi:hypothetical protein